MMAPAIGRLVFGGSPRALRAHQIQTARHPLGLRRCVSDFGVEPHDGLFALVHVGDERVTVALRRHDLLVEIADEGPHDTSAARHDTDLVLQRVDLRPRLEDAPRLAMRSTLDEPRASAHGARRRGHGHRDRSRERARHLERLYDERGRNQLGDAVSVRPGRPDDVGQGSSPRRHHNRPMLHRRRHGVLEHGEAATARPAVVHQGEGACHVVRSLDQNVLEQVAEQRIHGALV
jgi:hypothetical protein